MNLYNFFAALLIFVGLFFIKEWYVDNDNKNELGQHGVDTISQPFNEYVEEQENGRVVGYRVKAPFVTQSGSTATCSDSVSEGLINQFKSGAREPTVKVRYLPSKPTVCTIENAEYGSSIFMLIVGIAMILGSALYLFNSLGLSKDYE